MDGPDTLRELLFQLRQTFGQVEPCEVHVHVALELDLDGADARSRFRVRGGDDILDPPNLLYGRFQGRRQKRLDSLRGRARPLRPHGEPRELDVWKILDGDVPPGESAQEGDTHVGHRDSHGAADAQSDHVALPLSTTE